MAPHLQQQTGAVRPSLVLAILLVLSLACVTFYAREGEEGALHAIQNSVSGLMAPVKAVSGGVSAAEQSISVAANDAVADPNSLSALREQNEELRQTISQLEEFRQEAIRLEGMLEVRTSYNAQGIPGRVLARSADAWNKVVTIDVGTDEGVRAGLPVMGSSGLVGQVVSTTNTTADVRLLQDSKSGVAVIIQSSREEGIVHGSLEGLLYLDDIGDEVDVAVGDVVITSGLGGGYFRGIVVGTILKVEGEAGATSRKIIVEPNESMRPLEEVYVVTSMVSPYESLFKDSENMIDTDGDGVPDTPANIDDTYVGYAQDYSYQGYDDGSEG